MDLSTRVSTEANSLASKIFAKKDLLSTSNQNQNKKAKSAPNTTAAHKKKKNDDNDNDDVDGTDLPREPKMAKKHLSHKKDPISYEEQERTVFVGNLPNTVSHQQVEKFFTVQNPCGEVLAARMRNVRLAPLQEGQKDRGRGVRILRGEIDKSEESSASAYVVFKDTKGAKNALALTGSVFKNRHLSITSESPAAKAYEPRSSVYLGNLPYEVTDEQVWNFFLQPEIGLSDVTRIRIIRDSKTGKAKGFGYVEFASRESVVKALKLKNQGVINNRNVRIFSVHKSRDPALQGVKETRREKRAVAAVATNTGVAAAAATKKKNDSSSSSSSSATAAAVAAEGGNQNQNQKPIAKAPKEQGNNNNKNKKSGAGILPKVQDQPPPAWMGATVDPRKKLSKDLRWLTQHPNDRRAAAKARHKDRMRAAAVMRKKGNNNSGGGGGGGGGDE